MKTSNKQLATYLTVAAATNVSAAPVVIDVSGFPNFSTSAGAGSYDIPIPNAYLSASKYGGYDTLRVNWGFVGTTSNGTLRLINSSGRVGGVDREGTYTDVSITDAAVADMTTVGTNSQSFLRRAHASGPKEEAPSGSYNVPFQTGADHYGLLGLDWDTTTGAMDITSLVIESEPNTPLNAIPEPSAAALLALGASGLLLRRRRKAA